MIRREWKIRMAWLTLGILLGSAIGCSDFWRKDQCLDQGGSWSREKKECEFE